eukprot:317503-Pelagomonas_calceolata.AAC.1
MHAHNNILKHYGSKRRTASSAHLARALLPVIGQEERACSGSSSDSVCSMTGQFWAPAHAPKKKMQKHGVRWKERQSMGRSKIFRGAWREHATVLPLVRSLPSVRNSTFRYMKK